jgi:hypothetical protein
MIVQGKVIIVSDWNGIVEVFGRESDFNYWKFEQGIDIKDYEVEERVVNFSVSVEVNQ